MKRRLMLMLFTVGLLSAESKAPNTGPIVAWIRASYRTSTRIVSGLAKVGCHAAQRAADTLERFVQAFGWLPVRKVECIRQLLMFNCVALPNGLCTFDSALCRVFSPDRDPTSLVSNLAFHRDRSVRTDRSRRHAGRSCHGDRRRHARHSQRKSKLHWIDAPESSQACKHAKGRAYRCGALSANKLSENIGCRASTVRTRAPPRPQAQHPSQRWQSHASRVASKLERLGLRRCFVARRTTTLVSTEIKTVLLASNPTVPSLERHGGRVWLESEE